MHLLTEAHNNDHVGLSEHQPVTSIGWKAGISAELKQINEYTRLGKTSHYGPLRIQRPFWPEGKDLAHLYILHPPGGLVAGDELVQQFSVCKGAKGLVTTPAAGKVYFNGNGQLQKQITEISVSENGSMEWLPQETILFNGAIAELNTQIELSGNGLYAGWDIVCLGRTASGEQFIQGQLTQNLRITRDQKPIYLERLHFDAASSFTNSLLGLHGHTVFGTLLMTRDKSPDLSTLHSLLEEKEWHHVTAITWRAGVFIARYLGDSSEQARNIFTWLWEQERERFNGRSGCRPRIWNT
ncbi:urease accessory protein UreD [uncultured Endozoicomonas sp.]|uniref:urease accessory protein UreD n=1 Tax=uncultured Endozoicomonas sp. TaxID=432652 RepID=UPI00261F92ED|nr:urease accessory protein UreD [uncultured Endozoicomonas sp.]